MNIRNIASGWREKRRTKLKLIQKEIPRRLEISRPTVARHEEEAAASCLRLSEAA